MTIWTWIKKKIMGEVYDLKVPIQSLVAALNVVDGDGDGYISVGELIQMVKALDLMSKG